MLFVWIVKSFGVIHHNGGMMLKIVIVSVCLQARLLKMNNG
jgi:hypothetical protein